MSNKEEKLKCKLHYYSERGMMNALCYSLYGYKYARIHFLKTIMTKDGDKRLLSDKEINEIERIDIFNEFSFGDFGDPDLILKLTYKNEKNNILLFIEAKVGKYSQSASKAIDDGYKNNASKINFQLNLKKRFVEAERESETDEIVSKKVNEKDYDRALRKEALVKYIKKNIMVENVYYVSMTSDINNPYDNANLPFECAEDHLCYILYDSFYGKEKYEPNYKGIRSECVLYGNTYKMFEDAYKLANNEEVEE